VGFLRVLGFGHVFARPLGDVLVTKRFGDVASNRGDRLARHLHAVGPHIGDQANRFAAELHTFVKLLGDAHGRLRPHSQLAAGLLLQRAGGERRRRVALHAPPLDMRNGKCAGLDRRLGGVRLLGVVQIELIELAAVQMRQSGGEGRALGRGEHRLNRPVFAGAENLDFGFALADQAQGDGLHAAGAAAARQLAPQHGGQGEAYQIVQRAAGHVGFDQRLIELARMRHGMLHGRFGDFVERDALHVHAFQGVFVVQHGAHVPRNGLALAIRIGGQIEPLGAFESLDDGRHLACAALIGLPIHGEIFVRPHRAVLRR